MPVVRFCVFRSRQRVSWHEPRGANLSRHVTGDWGDLDRADAAENALSVREGFRLLSAYALPDGTRLWVITEPDRCATTLLLPDEY